MPIDVSYACPRCEQGVRAQLPEGREALACPACGDRIAVPAGAFEGDKLTRCLVCPSTDLFVRKDFPQRLGVTIVVLGFAISCITWNYYLTYWTFAVLFATAAIDVVLYWLVPNCLNCYRCDAQYRGVPGLERYLPFNLETHERYRQQAIRLRQVGGRTSPAPSGLAEAEPSQSGRSR